MTKRERFDDAAARLRVEESRRMSTVARGEGSREVYRKLLNLALLGLRREEATDSLDGLRARVAQLEALRADTIATLRSVCGELGDNDWSDDSHPSDIIRKHLADHLEAEHE